MSAIEVNIFAIIGVIIALVSAIVVFTVYLTRLDSRIRQLESQLVNHPLLVAFRGFERDKGAIVFMSEILKGSSVEK